MQIFFGPLGIVLMIIFLTLAGTWFLAARVTRLAGRPSARLAQLTTTLHAATLLYLRRFAGASTTVAAMLFIVLALLPTHGWQLAVAFLAGSLAVSLAAYAAVAVGARAQLAVVLAAEKSPNAAVQTAGAAGAAAGLLAGAAALGGLALLYIWLRLGGLEVPVAVNLLAAYAGGVVLSALFYRVGGGLFAKAADLGEALASEDENATLADNVGDLATDTAGTVAEAATAVTLAVVGAMWLSAGELGNDQMSTITESDVLLPLVGAAFALPALTLASSFLRGARVKKALTTFAFVTTVLSGIGFWVATNWLANTPHLAGAAGIGLLAAALGLLATELFAGERGRGVIGITTASKFGFSFATMAGLTAGLRGGAFLLLIAGGALAGAYALAGIAGLALAAVAVASLAPAAAAGAAFGAVADAADSLATLTAEHAPARAALGQLDAAGNTAAAIAKSYAALAATLGAIIFFQVLGANLFAYNPSLSTLAFNDAHVLAGLIAGVAAIMFVAARLFTSVSHLAIRFQNLLKTQISLEMLIVAGAGAAFGRTLPVLFSAVVTPLLTGYALGAGGVIGFLTGILLGGVLLTLTFVLAGSAWDNAKLAQPNTATLAADQIGDATKDAIGPGLIVFLQLTLLTAVLAAPLLARWPGAF